MLYLLLFTTLSLAMYTMATLNVQGAHNLSDVDRARASAESGLRWITWRFARLTNPKTTKGNIDADTAAALWPSIRNAIAIDVDRFPDAQDDMTWDPTGSRYTSSFIRTIPAVTNDPADRRFLNNTFQIIIRQHPLFPGDELDARYLRVSSVGRYGAAVKTISLDFVIDKKIKYAMVGKVPIQLGRNVMVEGPIAMTTSNRFPPILMLSDFKHLTNNLRLKLDSFEDFLRANHTGLDNRIFLHDPVEGEKALAAGYRDHNGDSFIDEYDLFLNEFDRDGDKTITKSEFTNPQTGKLYDPDLFLAIDTLGGPLQPNEELRPGLSYRPDGSIQGDDKIDSHDDYTKVRGQISLAAATKAWQSNLPSGTTIPDYFVGPISNTEDVVNPPVKMGLPASELLVLNPSNFDTSSFRTMTGPEHGTTQVSPTVIENKVIAPSDSSYPTVDERTPIGSTSFQATYRRPVYKNMTFKNVRIPKGLNALFENCTFEGVTFVELTTNITNSSGQTTTSPSEASTWAKRMISGSFANTTVLTASNSHGFKNGNNLRFNNCVVKGPLISDVPTAYSHFANSWEFTGSTTFDNTWTDASGRTTATIIGPQTNIEMGSFTDPAKAPSTLKGVVVAGNIDIRGSSLVDGSIIVTGDGAANTTMGWFGPSDGDTTTTNPMPEGGYGRLVVRYNPYLPLPDGINMPIVIVPHVNEFNQNTYTEGN
jgi:hypothetical protein